MYLLSFAASLAIFRLLNTDTAAFIPVINNLLIGAAVAGSLALQIFIIIKLIKSDIKNLLKIVLTIVLILIVSIWGMYLCILAVFTICDYDSFKYQGKEYYYGNEGFPDPYGVIYEKDDIFTMKELDIHKIKKIFSKADKIADKKAREFVISLTKEYNKMEKSYRKTHGIKDVEDEAKNEEHAVIKKTPQEILDQISIDRSIRISGSDFALTEVDCAAARSRWFFVRILDNKMVFISEIPDTSPGIKAKIDSNGSIVLECEDINGNVNKYKSIDEGLSWIKIK